jgi:hypothetical protein
MDELQTIQTHKIHDAFLCTILIINGGMDYIEMTKITTPKFLNAKIQSFEIMQ